MSQLGDNWWARFDRVTESGQRPYLFKRPYGSTFIDPINVEYALACLRNDTLGHPRLRFYIDFVRRNDLVSDFLSGQTSEERVGFGELQRFLASEHLAFIVNDLQDWSEPIADAVAVFLKDFIAHRGMPVGGVELVLFGGNYEGTPFGAHRGFEHALLIHVGPGQKFFHYWSPDDFVALTGGTDSILNYADLMPHATTVTMDAGDILYLPAAWYHLGTQETYSCSIAAALYQPTIDDLIRAGRPSESDCNSPLETQETLPYMEATGHGNPVASYLEGKINSRTQESLRQFLNDLWFKRLSNCGLHRTKTDLDTRPQLSSTDRLCVRQPYKLLQSRDADGKIAHLYLKHYTLKVPNRGDIEKLTDLLNNGVAMSIDGVASVLGKPWSIPQTARLLSSLAQTRGLEVIQ